MIRGQLYTIRHNDLPISFVFNFSSISFASMASKVLDLDFRSFSPLSSWCFLCLIVRRRKKNCFHLAASAAGEIASTWTQQASWHGQMLPWKVMEKASAIVRGTLILRWSEIKAPSTALTLFLGLQSWQIRIWLQCFYVHYNLTPWKYDARAPNALLLRDREATNQLRAQFAIGLSEPS